LASKDVFIYNGQGQQQYFPTEKRSWNNVQAQLPEAFIRQMKDMLGPEADRFLDSYNAPRTFGLRINPLKKADFAAIMEEMTPLFGLEPVPWCKAGYYYDEQARPGKHPYHAAGLYYIQEPSAMISAELLDPKPGEVVLDLAAAPGGKTTQIAGKMSGIGLLVANEIHPARAKILSENVERCGIPNAIVTSAAPDELSRRFPLFFDRIMLDAPCSGEGMFRKDEDAISEWSEAHVDMCAARQADILDHAAAMLKPGGRLVYSTCTFNRRENEETITAFCDRHPEFEVAFMERIWPHESRGEGHFAAILHKAGSEAAGAAEWRSRAGAHGIAGDMSKGISQSANAAAGEKGLLHTAANENVPLLAEEAALGHPRPVGGTSVFGGEAGVVERRKATVRRGGKHGAGGGRSGGGSGLAADMALLYAFAETALPGGLALGPGEPVRFGDALYWLPHTPNGSPITAGDLRGLKVVRPGLHLGDIRKNRLEPAHALALAVAPDTAAWVQTYRPDAPEIAAYLRGETIPAHENISGWGLVAVDGLPLGWGKASAGQIKNHLPKGLRRF
jgi:NOL1/NOP2/sun family putative RNA methylase